MQVHQEQPRFDFCAPQDLMSPSGSQLAGVAQSGPPDLSPLLAAGQPPDLLEPAGLLGLEPPPFDAAFAAFAPPSAAAPSSAAAAVAAALLAANCYDAHPQRSSSENVPVDLDRNGFEQEGAYFNVSDFCSSVAFPASSALFCQPLSISTSSNVLDPLHPSAALFLPQSRKEEKQWLHCGTCLEPIRDRFIMNVNNLNYHSNCLRCSQCLAKLDEAPSCYVKHDQLHCKPCYVQKFQSKCAHCERQIQPNDWVRRARSLVFHLACFSCNHCKRQLSTGEQFSLQENRLLCKQHYLELVQGEDTQQKQKTKRVRTTFAEEQLSILQAHFQMDSNPDGADLERIAALTGLSKRVTQVWFQNSRARQKKYQGSGSKKTCPGSVQGTSSASGRSSRTTSHSNQSPAPKSPDENRMERHVQDRNQDQDQAVSAALAL